MNFYSVKLWDIFIRGDALIWSSVVNGIITKLLQKLSQAARRPGGSIGPLIDVSEDQESGWFAQYEFRASLRLKLPERRGKLVSCGDLLVPLRIGTLVKMPTTECPIRDVEYRQIAKIGTHYTGFSINHMNTCARLVAKCEGKSADEIEALLFKAKEWLDSELIYEKSQGIRTLKIQEAEKQGQRAAGSAMWLI